MISSPYNNAIKKDRIIKGPKGIGSFLVFIFIAIKIREIIAPKIKDKSMVNIICFIPKRKPRAPIKVTSPPPIPPLENITIIKNKTPAKRSPPKESISLIGVLYKI